MIFLIVNADDFGINPQRDRGIIEAFAQGIVSSATMLANGASFDSATVQAKEFAVPVGVHLNLSEGTTLSGPITGLTDPKNKLPGKAQMRKYLLGDHVDMPAVRREFSLQIEKTMAAGLRPDHLDGHQHCHVYPALTDMIIELAKEYGIDAFRSVCPADPVDAVVPEELVEDISLFRSIGDKAKALFDSSGIRTPRGLWGLPQLHTLDTKVLCELLEKIPDGHWELMTHPGYPYPEGRHFESPQRLTELKALCSPGVKEIITHRHIRLGTFGELPCVY
jgi:predicted glycoside hydrolase/deacetylase ChbG (UPF0249 family)